MIPGIIILLALFILVFVFIVVFAKRKTSHDYFAFFIIGIVWFIAGIGFIDVFEDSRGFVLNEINRKCSLFHVEKACKINLAKKIVHYLVEQARK